MALRYLMAVPDAKETIEKHFHVLFSAILLKIGSYNGARAPDIKRGNSETSPDKSASGDKSKNKQQKSKPVKTISIVPSE